MPDAPRTTTFDQQTERELIQALKAVAQSIPEVDALCCTVSWRMPQNPGIMRCVLVGPDGPPTSPVQLMRILRELSHAQEFVLGMLDQQLNMIDQRAGELAQRVEQLGVPPQRKDEPADPQSSAAELAKGANG